MNMSINKSFLPSVPHGYTPFRRVLFVAAGRGNDVAGRTGLNYVLGACSAGDSIMTDIPVEISPRGVKVPYDCPTSGSGLRFIPEVVQT